ncbi:MAG: acetate--CoA ligase family protein [bacterium]|nr:acetate--CoA ligase family protein [bacterium]
MGVLSEFDSKQLLASHGVQISNDLLVASADAAAEAALQLAGPVALKLCGQALAHKSERGLVKLGLDDPASVKRAAQELLATITAEDGEVALLVSQMVTGHREFIIGVARTAQFGAVLMLGLGGVLAEATANAVFRLLPVTHQDCQDMIHDLDAEPLLAEFRGEAAVDQHSLVNALLAIASAAATDGIEEIDVNPLIICQGQPVAVDALVVTTNS